MDAPEAPGTPGVTVSETALTVTEEDTTGDTYTVVLNTQPTSSVTVEVAGHASTDVTATPASLTFTTSNWSTAKTVTVTAGNDANTADETINLTHSATSSDSDYGGITIAGVDVMVEDNDTAKVTGVALTPGDEELGVAWTAVANATGYQVQWKSGGQSYNTSGRQATISSGSTVSHTISSLTNGTTYTVRMRAVRTGANNGPYSDEEMDAPVAGNTLASGAPAITGAAQVGKVLTAGLGTIADSDGLPGTFPDDYTFQWVRVDADGVSNESDISGRIRHLHGGRGGRGQEDQGGGELHRRRGHLGGTGPERRLSVERPGGGGGGRLPGGQRLVHDADGRVRFFKDR